MDHLHQRNTLLSGPGNRYNAMVQQPLTLTKKFARNQQGRDFIVGDIHGCFGMLKDALASHQFNTATDRLFAVGDLIDRGPDSHKVMDWLEQPWFHSCLGNHEEMLINANADSVEGLNWFHSYGGNWWLEQDSASQARIRTALAELPLAIELETGYGSIGIVHADIPKNMSWSGFIRLLEMGDMDVRKTALWGRSRIKRLFNSPVKGIDRVVCGHSVTPNRKIVIKANVWFIETGAFLQDDHARLHVIPSNQFFE